MSDHPKTLYEGRFLKLLSRGSWEYCERRNVTDIAGIVTVTDRDEAVFVEQFRIPLQAKTIEWPAGLIGDIDAGESIDIGANRELVEETGYRAASFELLAKIPSSAGLTSETVLLLLAHDLEKVGDGGGMEDENITVHHVPLTEVEPWLRAREQEGMLVDSKVWAGLYFLLRQFVIRDTAGSRPRL